MISIVTLIDINRAIIENVTLALAETEFSNIKFSSTAIVEGITRPSFYLDFETNKTKKPNCKLKERNLNVKLFYFAKTRDNCKIELLKIEEMLENLFLEEIKITDSFYLPTPEVEFDVNKTDGYLTAEFELYSLEEIEIVDLSEPAEELIYSQK